ncbi:MAG: CPBP family intramembrane metalloprotease, partial [Candidatus Eisenbacteria bacterium]|nr:CPBP family intramembrane metalloprotease [Candidatus Eisenbacteria bacterium]
LQGLRRYLSRLRLWRCSRAWWALLVVGLPLVFFIGAVLKGDLIAAMPRFSSWQSLATLLGLALIKGPVEEFGWRGLALPLLQRRLAPIWAALILGMVWGFWHLPAFMLSGTQQSAWSFAPFFVGTVAISVLMTALFNASAGSTLLAALFHFQLINPLWPEAQPYDTYLLVVVAALVVVLNRGVIFSRDGASTEVIPRA